MGVRLLSLRPFMVTIFLGGHLQESTPLHLAPAHQAHQLHMNLVGARAGCRLDRRPSPCVDHKYAPMWAMQRRSRIRYCDSGHSGQSRPMPSIRNGKHQHRCNRPTCRRWTCTPRKCTRMRKCQHRRSSQEHPRCLCSLHSGCLQHRFLQHRCLQCLRTPQWWHHHQRKDQDPPPAYARL